MSSQMALGGSSDPDGHIIVQCQSVGNFASHCTEVKILVHGAAHQTVLKDGEKLKRQIAVCSILVPGDLT